MVILDSGGYEASAWADLDDPCALPETVKPWDQCLYEEVVSQVKLEVPTVIVSFDHAVQGIPLHEQIGRARDFFSRYPRVASTFLLKPTAPGEEVLCMEEITSSVTALSPFSVIGVTEKELGNSLLDRLLNLARLRGALDGAGLGTPIHVFGALDTVLPPLYFLAGADVFDGLAWLRYAFHAGDTLYVRAYAAQYFDPDIPEMDVLFRVWTNNYYELLKLQEDMRAFAKTGQYSCFRYHAAFYQRMIHRLSDILEAS
jgi:hypothetical protein